MFCVERVQVGFIITEVSRPLLGADFLRANSLLVELKGKRLVDAKTYFSSPLCEAGTLAPYLSAISQPRNDYNELIASFPEITIPNFSTLPTKHGVEHFIKTFKLDSGGKTETITVARLKPAHLDLESPVQVAQSSPRGRPKSSRGAQASGPH